MFYDGELQFLINVFEKSRIPITFADSSDSADALLDMSFEKMAGYPITEELSVGDYFGKIEPNTMYKLSDHFGISYIYLLLPEKHEKPIMLIGPCISLQPTPRRLLEIAEKNGIKPKHQKIFEMKYEGISVLPDGSALPVMLDAFCELIFGSSFRIAEIQKGHTAPVSPLGSTHNSDDFDETMVKMENIQKRYDYENELMQAVRLGHVHKVDLLFSAFSEQSFEKRVPDPLRNKKNYLIITNTILRKAAEQGGVHPIYLDSISSSFAARIEALSALSETSALMQEMFRSYCRLVRTHSMRDYSPLIQKVITLIDSDLSANLTLSTIAAGQNVSPGYLCALFKKETGRTVTEFIRDKRIKHASHLLRTTHLQIQTIALHCGIMDVQYFSKIFKKLVGMTPKEYREAAK